MTRKQMKFLKNAKYEHVVNARWEKTYKSIIDVFLYEYFGRDFISVVNIYEPFPYDLSSRIQYWEEEKLGKLPNKLKRDISKMKKLGIIK